MVLRRIKTSVGAVRVGFGVVVGVRGSPFEWTRYLVFVVDIMGNAGVSLACENIAYLK